MIDEKKIEKAAIACADEYYAIDLGKDREETNRELFTRGAHWAIEQFLKDLWHPASKEPKKAKNLLLETTYEYGNPIYHLIKYMPNGNNACAWREWYKGAHVSRWLYVDDLMPNKKGDKK